MVPVLFTFYLQGVLKLKKNSGAKRLTTENVICLKLMSNVPAFAIHHWLTCKNEGQYHNIQTQANSVKKSARIYIFEKDTNIS